MEMDTDRLGGFLIGLGVGTVIGILLAPATGRQVRERIKEKAGEGTEYLKQRGSELKESAAELLEKGKATAGRVTDNATHIVAAGTDS